MKLVFQDQAFSFELLRTVSYAAYDGADIGECLATAYRIAEGDFASWWAEWSTTAARVEAIAGGCLDAGHYESARRAYLRASNYYRTAEFFLHLTPQDPRVLQTWGKSAACFRRAAELTGPTWEAVEIPYEGTTLPSYFYAADASGAPRPTLIFHGGFDSTVEELYFTGAAAALRHGYNCLTFDGPGQGRPIREQGLRFRPDWEAVVTPVVNYALARPEVDPARMALMGMSQGGYFAPCAAAFEPRLAALVAYDGVFDCYAATRVVLPPPVAALLEQGPATAIDAALRTLIEANPSVRWALSNGMWT